MALKLLAFLSLGLPLAAQITVSPLTTSVGQLQDGQEPYWVTFGNNGNFTIGGTGGTLNANCTGNATFCKFFRFGFDATTAPTNLHLSCQTGCMFSVVPGTYSANITVSSAAGCTGSCIIAVTVTIKKPENVIVQDAGPRTNCTTVGFPYKAKETCPIPNVRPGGTANPPSSRASVQDSILGWTIHNMTPNDGKPYAINGDSVSTQINATNTLFGVQRLSDGANILVDRNGTIQYSSLPNNCSADVVDPTDPTGNTRYCLDSTGPRILKVVLGSGSGCAPQHCKVTTVLRVTGTSTRLSNGGDGGPTRSVGGKIFWGAGTKEGHVIIANLTDGTYVDYDATSFDSNSAFGNGRAPGMADFGSVSMRIVELSKGITKGKLYAYIGSYQGNSMFLSWDGCSVCSSPGNTRVVNEGYQPVGPRAASIDGSYIFQPSSAADCHGTPGICNYAVHADWVEAGGHQCLVQQNTATYTSHNGPGFECIDFGGPSKMVIPFEFGGGFFQPFNDDDADLHLGCATTAPVCVIGPDGTPIKLPSANIIRISGSVVTFGSTPPVVTNDPLLINGAIGCPQVNARVAANRITVSDNNVTIPGLSCSPAWSSGGTALKDTIPATAPFQGTLYVIDATNISADPPTFNVLFGTQTRQWQMTDNISGPTAYWSQLHPVISPDGTVVAWMSNWGMPNTMNVFWALDGHRANSFIVSGNSIKTKHTQP